MLLTGRRAIVAVVAAGLLLSGCTDHKKIKEEVQNAVSKQGDMTKYSFAGDADIDLGAVPAAKDSNSATASLLGMFINGKLNWQGKLSKEPLQLEVRLKSQSAALPIPLEMPMLIKDNKMYINIPLISKNDEYFVIDASSAGTAAGQKPLLSPDSLKNLPQLTGSFIQTFIGDLDPKFFSKSTKPDTLTDGKQAYTYSVEITDKNKQQFNDILHAKLPEMVDQWQKNGVLTPGQTDLFKRKSLTINTPGKMSFTVDQDGFIRDESIHLEYTETASDGTTANRHVQLHQTFDQINQDPKFEMEVPKQTKPFEDVLKLLNGAKQG